MHAEPGCKMQRKQHIYVDVIIQGKKHLVGPLIYIIFTLWTLVFLLYESFYKKHSTRMDGIW